MDPVDKKVKEDVANALFELMEGYIKVKEKVKPTEKSKDETGRFLKAKGVSTLCLLGHHA